MLSGFIVNLVKWCSSCVVQFVNDLHALISPVPKGTPLPLVLLGKVMLLLLCLLLELVFSKHWLIFWFWQSKNALLSTFLFLDQIVWLGRTGIYKVRRSLLNIGDFISFRLNWAYSVYVMNHDCFTRTKNVLRFLDVYHFSVGWVLRFAHPWLRSVHCHWIVSYFWFKCNTA